MGVRNTAASSPMPTATEEVARPRRRRIRAMSGTSPIAWTDVIGCHVSDVSFRNAKAIVMRNVLCSTWTASGLSKDPVRS